MKMQSLTHVLASLLLGTGIVVSLTAQMPATGRDGAELAAVPSRVLQPVNEAKLTRLAGNTYPATRFGVDQGRVESRKMLERMVMVLKRSPEQEAALEAFNERQYDPKSPDFHHWLHADEFGRLYGPSDSDITQVTSWLESHGFRVDNVSKGRVSIQFSGTVGQVEQAFHLEMHHYLVGGTMHIANDRDPSIPEALSPVITGIASLHDFFPKHYSHPGAFVKRDLKTGKYTLVGSELSTGSKLEPLTGSLGGREPGVLVGKGSTGGVQPEFGYVDPNTGYQREELTPYDVATIYNILPLWNASTPINGTGVKVAIVALSDIVASDLNTYRSSFGLPATTLVTMHSGADPGITDSQGENTEDTEMVSATAPGATIVLVADVDNATTDGLITAITYIVDNEVAPILTMSYGECELNNGTAGNALFNSTFQQAATSGISSFVAAGDSGSAVCTSQNGTPPYADTYGLAVSGMADSPYVTAVGGTDLQWPFVQANFPYTDYWNTTNAANGSSAKGYMPEMSWNDTCTNPFLLYVYTAYADNEALCNAAISPDPGLVEMASGSGGVSNCTAPTGTTPSTCAGGYAKPSWQTGVTGIPADGKRDLPDVSMFAAYGFQYSTGLPGSALLICQASASPTSSCDYSDPRYIIYQENGGTSAASPLTAGIMAMVIQKTGSPQGLANPMFYKLASQENYANCNSNIVQPGNNCIFYDVTAGSNAAVCITGDPNCVTNTTGDQVGLLSGYASTTGYDLTTGLGTFNVANLVNAWSSVGGTPSVSLTPSSLTFTSPAVGTASAAQSVTIMNTSTGLTPLIVSSVTLSGTNSSAFTAGMTTTCPTNGSAGWALNSGVSCTFSFEFTPTATGTETATVNFNDNVSGSPQTVSLSGSVVATGAPVVSLSATSLSFGNQLVGTSSSSQSVTLTNTGNAALSISSINVTGTGASSYAFANSCGTSVAVGGNCTIHGHFSPTAAGALAAAITITDNAGNSPQSVTLTGTGVTTPTVSLSAASLSFGTVLVGSTSASQSVTLTNTGGLAVSISSIAVTGTNASSFMFASSCGSTLAAGANCTVHGHFTPTAGGPLTAAVTITDNASGSPQHISLSGTGGTTVSLSATSLSFGNETVGGTSASQSVTLTNTGKATLFISSVAVTGANASSFIFASSCGSTLAAAANCTVHGHFSPTTNGALTAAVTITDSATNSPQSITLTGTGGAPVVSLSATSLSFGNQSVGTSSASQSVTLTNTGNAALSISSINVTGTGASSFAFANSCGTSVAAGANCTIHGHFSPVATGALTAAITITDNAANSPQSISLSGTGK